MKFLSTLSLRRATQRRSPDRTHQRISIHALLAESDYCVIACTQCGLLFLSTLSLRRATALVKVTAKVFAYFYPRSPCGERLCHHISKNAAIGISIHALLAESDLDNNSAQVNACYISIHALLAESDRAESDQRHSPNNFYPRSPCGERPSMCIASNFQDTFLSTLSLRRATRPRQVLIIVIDNFYPRSPCGERPPVPCLGTRAPRFLSTLSLRRATNGALVRVTRAIFLSTLSLRRATRTGSS